MSSIDPWLSKRAVHHSTNLFTYDVDNRMFYSYLKEFPGLIEDRLFDGYDEMGFILVSARTDKKLPFVRVATETNKDGLVLAWVYESWKNHAAWENTIQVAGLDVYRAIIFMQR